MHVLHGWRVSSQCMLACFVGEACRMGGAAMARQCLYVKLMWC
jgi:hypothetical protein